MSTGYVIPEDPAHIAARCVTWDDPLTLLTQEADPEDDVLTPSYEAMIEPLLPMIPKREADLIHMYFIQKKRQADIAIIFGVTQAAVSYRLDRGVQRIKFLLSIPNLHEKDLRTDLPEVFPTKEDGTNIDVDILVGMWKTTCQSEVANRLGLTQGRVRHRFFKAVSALKEKALEDPRFTPYSQLFGAIAGKRFNILREVSLPQWADRGGDECL